MVLHSFRFIADALWQYKILGVLSSLLLLCWFLAYTYIGLYERRKIIHGGRTSVILVLLFILFSISYIRNIDIQTSIIYFKIATLVLVYFYGLYSEPSNVSKYILSILCFAFIISFFISLIVGVGWQSWGAYKTFVGPYFFKTDLATAVTLFVAIYLAYSKNNTAFKITIYLIGMVLIFYANSRLYYLIYILSGIVYVYRFHVFKGLSLKKISLYLTAAIVIPTIYYVVSSTIGDGILLFDLSDGLFSDKNMQGRNSIWISILSGYWQEFSMLEKVIGQHLDSDRVLSDFWKNDDIHAHSTYIFVLTATGYVGLSLLISFIAVSMSSAKKVMSFSKDRVSDLYLLLISSLVFVVGGLSNTTIVFLQTSWFFFYYCGQIRRIEVKVAYESSNCS